MHPDGLFASRISGFRGRPRSSGRGSACHARSCSTRPDASAARPVVSVPAKPHVQHSRARAISKSLGTERPKLFYHTVGHRQLVGHLVALRHFYSVFSEIECSRASSGVVASLLRCQGNAFWHDGILLCVVCFTLKSEFPFFPVQDTES